MLNNFVPLVAFKYFRAKQGEKFVSLISGFSLLGVTIGVAALIVVMSVMKGFHREFIKNIIGLNGDISITSTEKVILNYDDIQKKLLEKNYITRVVPSVVGQALALGPRVNNGVLIKGILKEDLKYRGEILKNVISGDFSDFSGIRVAAAIGSELAYSLGVGVGDKLKLISPNTISTAFGSMPRSKEFEIIAIFSSGMYDYDSATILMPLEGAQKFLSFENGINLIEVSIGEPGKVDVLTKEIQKLLEPSLRASNWQKSNLAFLNALATEQVAMFTILSLIIIVAAFNIISSLFMLVKDKTKDIAILKTIGASKRQIMLIFVCNGMFIGLIGTISGMMLGVSFALNIDRISKYLEQITGAKIFDAVIYFLYTLPSDVQADDVWLVGGLSLLICLTATLYPSYKASKLNPVDAFRYE